MEGNSITPDSYRAVLRDLDEFEQSFPASVFLRSYALLRSFGRNREAALATLESSLPVEVRIQLAAALDDQFLYYTNLLASERPPSLSHEELKGDLQALLVAD